MSSTPQGPIARRLADLRAQGQAVARDQRTATMRPGPSIPPRPNR